MSLKFERVHSDVHNAQIKVWELTGAWGAIVNSQWIIKVINAHQLTWLFKAINAKHILQATVQAKSSKSAVTPNVFTEVFLMSIRQLRVRQYTEMMRQEMWVVGANTREVSMIIHILGSAESCDIWGVSKWPSFFVRDYYIQRGIRERPINLSRELCIATSAFLYSVVQKLCNKRLWLTRPIWTTI